MWSVTLFFFFLCHLLNIGACICQNPPGKANRSRPNHTTPHHTIKKLHFVLFQSVTCYTNSIVSRIHVNTAKLRNITCTLVATRCGVILRSLECILITRSMVAWIVYGIWAFQESVNPNQGNTDRDCEEESVNLVSATQSMLTTYAKLSKSDR